MHIEKLEECPRCGEVKRWKYDAQICAVCDYGNRPIKESHRERAVMAIANEFCVTELTDGFCAPERSPDCKCVQRAKRALRGLETRAMKPVWVFDKEPIR